MKRQVALGARASVQRLLVMTALALSGLMLQPLSVAQAADTTSAVEADMTIVGFDKEVAEANGYEIMTVDGVATSIPQGGTADWA